MALSNQLLQINLVYQSVGESATCAERLILACVRQWDIKTKYLLGTHDAKINC